MLIPIAALRKSGIIRTFLSIFRSSAAFRLSWWLYNFLTLRGPNL